MNYYERHLGDYARDTAHLSLLEHGVYTLLLDRYYATEEPIPGDQAHRLARARTEDERAAVDIVLSEFFQKQDSDENPVGFVWVNRRVEEEIEKARHRIDTARENGKKGGRPRKSAEKNPKETQGKPSGLPVGTPEETQPVTGSKAHQTPDTRHQELASLAPAREPSDAGRACLLMRQAGCTGTNPSHPALLAALAEGVTPEALAATASEGIEAGKSRPFAWAITTSRSRHAEGAAPIATGDRHEAPRKLSSIERIEANVRRGQQHDADGFIDAKAIGHAG